MLGLIIRIRESVAILARVLFGKVFKTCYIAEIVVRETEMSLPPGTIAQGGALPLVYNPAHLIVTQRGHHVVIVCNGVSKPPQTILNCKGVGRSLIVLKGNRRCLRAVVIGNVRNSVQCVCCISGRGLQASNLIRSRAYPGIQVAGSLRVIGIRSSARFWVYLLHKARESVVLIASRV